MTVHCWVSRYEALGFASMTAAMIATDWDGDENSLHDYLDGICLREDGHGGEHKFIAPRDITVTFAPTPMTGGEGG